MIASIMGLFAGAKAFKLSTKLIIAGVVLLGLITVITYAFVSTYNAGWNEGRAVTLRQIEEANDDAVEAAADFRRRRLQCRELGRTWNTSNATCNEPIEEQP